MPRDPKVTRQQFAHTLLSPLTVIRGSVEMLKNQDTMWPAYARELLGLALAQAQHLQDILNDLIATAEVDGDTVRVSWQATEPPHPEGSGGPPQPEQTGTPENS